MRLSRSALVLKRQNVRITDVAFELGFGSVDGYIRAFSREFGITPGEYAKDPVPVSLFVPYGAKFKALRKEKASMGNIKSVFIQKIQKPARKVIIKRGKAAKDYFAYCDEVGCDVWGILLSMVSLCGEPVCLWLPENTSIQTPPLMFRALRLPKIIPELFRRALTSFPFRQLNILCFRANRLKKRIAAKLSAPYGRQ